MSAVDELLHEWRDRPTITRHSHREQIEGIEALRDALVDLFSDEAIQAGTLALTRHVQLSDEVHWHDITKAVLNAAVAACGSAAND